MAGLGGVFLQQPYIPSPATFFLLTGVPVPELSLTTTPCRAGSAGTEELVCHVDRSHKVGIYDILTAPVMCQVSQRLTWDMDVFLQNKFLFYHESLIEARNQAEVVNSKTLQGHGLLILRNRPKINKGT